MRSKRVLLAIVLTGVSILVGCGSNSATLSPAAAGSPVSLVMGDNPPSGVTILSFRISVTGATLNSSGTQIQLIQGEGIEVEVEDLQVEKAFISTANAPAGTYDSITVTFANPKLTILNNSGAAIGNCASGAACKLTPALSPASVTDSSAPFPLTISANSPVGLLMDFNLNASIQSDLSITPTISFTQLAAKQGEDGSENEDFEEIDDIMGQFTALDATNSTITIMDNSSGQSFTAKVDSNTRIEGFEEIGLADSFSSFKIGQIVEVNLMLLADGTFRALKVELQQQEGLNEDELAGTVVAVDSPTEFKMVLEGEAPDDNPEQIGNTLTVTIQSGTTFQIDTDGMMLPAGLTFQSSADLLVGQHVQIRIPSGTVGSSVSTDQVTLHRSQVTATVMSTSVSTFTLNNLSSLFTSATPPITQIDVQTSPQTVFENVSDVTGLKAGDQVSVRGLLFKTAGTPLMVADAVTKRLPEN